MAKSIITTDFPTPEEVAAFYGIPDKRVAELRAMIAADRQAIADRKARAKRRPATRAKKK
jgi:hypothetical protein